MGPFFTLLQNYGHYTKETNSFPSLELPSHDLSLLLMVDGKDEADTVELSILPVNSFQLINLYLKYSQNRLFFSVRQELAWRWLEVVEFDSGIIFEPIDFSVSQALI